MTLEASQQQTLEEFADTVHLERALARASEKHAASEKQCYDSKRVPVLRCFFFLGLFLAFGCPCPAGVSRVLLCVVVRACVCVWTQTTKKTRSAGRYSGQLDSRW